MNSSPALSVRPPFGGSLLSAHLSYHFVAVYIPIAVALLAALFGLLSYTAKSKALNITAWILAIVSLCACDILKDTRLAIYSAALVASCFIALLARAEMRSSGWYCIFWSVLISIASFTLASLVAKEAMNRVWEKAFYATLDQLGDIFWLEHLATYISAVFLFLFSLPLTWRVLDRMQLLPGVVGNLMRAAAISILTGFGTLICLILYGTMGVHCFPITFSDDTTDIGIAAPLILISLLALHGMAVYKLKEIVQNRLNKTG